MTTAPFTVSIDTGAVEAALSSIQEKLQNPQQFLAATQLLMIEQTARGFAAQVDPDGTAWTPLKTRKGQALRDTGLLLNSITSGAIRNQGEDFVSIGTNRVYARLHNYGGTVAPKSAKMLAIPLNTRARRAGSPRNIPDLFIRRSARGNLIAFERDGESVIPMFLLRERVTIPARKFLGWGRRNIPPVIEAWRGILRARRQTA